MALETNKIPESMTSEELEKAIKEHRAFVRKQIEEAQSRRMLEKEQSKKTDTK